MSKFSLLPLTVTIAAGLTLCPQARAQTMTGGTTSSDPFGGAPGMGGTGARSGRPAPSDANQGQNGETPDDDTMYRMKTKDSVGSGAMVRDDGELTAKLKRREKVSKVESAKQLPTSGTDSKFSSSLLQSSVTSIQDVSEKKQLQLQPKAEASEKENADAPKPEQGEARFKAQQLMLNPSADEPTKKKDSPRTKAQSSPSPSPSPKASVNPSSR